MDAFAQRTPPIKGSEVAALKVAIKVLVVLQAIMTSSALSQFNNVQPSSVNPFIASLKPLERPK